MPNLLKLNLQFFADGDADSVIDNSQVDNTPKDDDLSGEEELFKAIQSLKDSDDKDDDDDNVDEDKTDDDDKVDDDDDDVVDEDDLDDDNNDDDLEDDKGTAKKKVQSKEDNAKFAAQRREQEVQKRVQAELDKLKQESPEFKLAKQLSDTFGKPVEQIMDEMKEAALQKEAQEAKIPVEILRKQRDSDERADKLEAQLNQLRFQNWQTQIKADGAKLMGDYKILTQEDIDGAVDYILNKVKNVEMPLEEAVYALHGKKIVDSLAKAKVQDDLAKQSGRKKKTPPSPNNGKTSKVTTLTADEQTIAKAFGMTNDEYIKYKS